MPARNLPATADDPPSTKRARIPRIPAKVRDACDLIADKQVTSIKEAAERVGLSREHLSRMLNRPHVQVFMARDARRTIAMAAQRASRRMVELLDAGSEHVSLDASKHVLAIEGIKPRADAQVSVNIELKAGYVIDLREPGEARAVIGHERGNSANPLIDHESGSDDVGNGMGNDEP